MLMRTTDEAGKIDGPARSRPHIIQHASETGTTLHTDSLKAGSPLPVAYTLIEL